VTCSNFSKSVVKTLDLASDNESVHENGIELVRQMSRAFYIGTIAVEAEGD
jgi:hypothetical protein